MLEAAELGDEVSRREYEKLLPDLRVDLLNAQFDLHRRADFPVILMIVGDDRAGCNEVVHALHEWIDARYVLTRAFGPPTEEEQARPPFWRYWRSLPRRGQIGVYIGGMFLDTIADRVLGRIDDEALELRMTHANAFNRTLVADGALFVRVWLHLPKKKLKKRLAKSRKSPLEAWRVEERDWRIYDRYEEVMPVVEQVLRDTNSAESPWTLVESTDKRYRDLVVGQTLLAALQARLEVPPAPATPGPSAAPSSPSLGSSLLDRVDLSATIDPDAYDKTLDKLQVKLSRLTKKAVDRKRSTVMVFEGWDAAGKGGVIRRITAAMHVRDYQLVPIAAPTEEERGYHWLWRFWRHIPRAGRTVIFDRSWYGRVLVERVEGLTPEADWRRGYDEINDFEAQLVEHGATVLKFWLHIDPDEQLRRFEARKNTRYKKHKLTDEDYRNREKRDLYTDAVNEMVARTSSEIAPWHLVPANDKRVARIRVLQTVCDALSSALKGKGR